MSDQAHPWQPLSVRRGLRPKPELSPGIPPQLMVPLRYWMEGRFGYRTQSRSGRSPIQTSLILRIAARTGIQIAAPTYDPDQVMHDLLNSAQMDETLFLDVLDAVLDLNEGAMSPSTVEQILRDGGSIWSLRGDGRGLVELAGTSMQAAVASATEADDLASQELEHAWLKVYGVHADASDAWDHAIKAVEALAIPIVVPKQEKAQLGHVIGQLGQPNAPYDFRLGGADGLLTFVLMLRLLWPNPDRHADERASRVPSHDEARAVVNLAVTIVQWLRDGALARA